MSRLLIVCRPLTILVALFWTWPNFSLSLWNCGTQLEIGVDLQGETIGACDADLMLLLMYFNIAFAFFNACITFLVHVQHRYFDSLPLLFLQKVLNHGRSFFCDAKFSQCLQGEGENQQSCQWYDRIFINTVTKVELLEIFQCSYWGV